MSKISACVIVKNEAANIGHWLDCVRPIADEIIVVDTGSTDDTAEIAKQGGAIVDFFPWKDDFAAAKNYALSKATGEWIIFLDADEYFSPQTAPHVREVIAKYQRNPKIVGIICRLVNVDKDQNFRFQGTASQVRIFRNLPSLRYEGAVHEILVNKRSHDRRFEVSRELEIYHTGYSTSIQRQKVDRNLKILLASGDAESDGNALAMMDCYYGLEDYEKAELYARRAIAATGLRYIGLETHPYETLISIYMRTDSYEKTLPIIAKAKDTYPMAVVFWVYDGVCRFELQDYQQAEECLLKAIELCQKDKTREKLDGCLSDGGVQHLPLIYFYLGRIKQLRLDSAGAAEYFLKSLQGFPYRAGCLLRLLDCLQGTEPTEIISLLNSLYDKKNDAPFLCQVLRPEKEKAVYLYYSRMGNINNRLADFLAADRTDAAAAKLAETNERLYSLGLIAAERCGKIPGSELWPLLPEPYRKKWLNRLATAKNDEKYPKVSIMIPTYNRPELFEKTLQSALNQEYDDYEVIVCDNSTDERTAAVIEKYQTDPHLRYYRNREAKTKEANFIPFENLAQGEYLQWCMDDDLLDADKLCKMAGILDNNPGVTLVTSQRRAIDENGNVTAEHFRPVGIKEEFERFSGRQAIVMMLTNLTNFIGEPSAVLFRRKDLQDHYWHADCRGYKTISDVVMWVELLEKGDLVIFRDALSSYRRHENQEGVQPDVILLSRIEWVQIIEEMKGKGFFVDNETDYRKGLTNLYRERTQLSADFGSAGMRQRYFQCIEKIGRILEINHDGK